MTLRKSRTGRWAATRWSMANTGGGSIHNDGGGIDDDVDDDDDYDEDERDSRGRFKDPNRRIQQLSNEAKRRRQKAKEWRQRAEAAESKLAQLEGGNGNATTGADADTIVAMIEAGLKKDRLRAALRLVDWDSVDDPEDAIDQLREDHPFLFDEPGAEQDSDLPKGRTAPAINNSQRKPRRSESQKQAELARKFPALRGRVS